MNIEWTDENKKFEMGSSLILKSYMQTSKARQRSHMNFNSSCRFSFVCNVCAKQNVDDVAAYAMRTTKLKFQYVSLKMLSRFHFLLRFYPSITSFGRISERIQTIFKWAEDDSHIKHFVVRYWWICQDTLVYHFDTMKENAHISRAHACATYCATSVANISHFVSIHEFNRVFCIWVFHFDFDWYHSHILYTRLPNIHWINETVSFDFML